MGVKGGRRGRQAAELRVAMCMSILTLTLTLILTLTLTRVYVLLEEYTYYHLFTDLVALGEGARISLGHEGELVLVAPR